MFEHFCRGLLYTSLAWYTGVTLFVAVLSLFEVRTMLRKLAEEARLDEPVAASGARRPSGAQAPTRSLIVRARRWARRNALGGAVPNMLARVSSSTAPRRRRRTLLGAGPRRQTAA